MQIMTLVKPTIFSVVMAQAPLAIEPHKPFTQLTPPTPPRVKANWETKAELEWNRLD